MILLLNSTFLTALLVERIPKLSHPLKKYTSYSLRIGNFLFCAFHLRVNDIKTLLCRTCSLSSNYQFSHREFGFLEQFFHSRNFPLKLFGYQFSFFLYNMFELTVPEPNDKLNTLSLFVIRLV